MVLLLLVACVSVEAQRRINLNAGLAPFYHGVESGDPESDRVIIWTRITPDSGTTGDVPVYWQVATDTNFSNIVNYGKALATDSNHNCVKVDVCGLQPSTYYYYMFNGGGRNSIMGRTKTAPAPGADVDSLRFAVVSCASWEHGYFNTYQSISTHNDVDAVVHVGDYIYEYASGDYSANISGRTYQPPTECVDELGYELRYSQYKLDDQLRRVHQLFPFITVWDDHETSNNAWSEGAPNHNTATEGPYDLRKYNSTSTYFKWMPLRKPDPMDTLRIFRKLRYGKLLDLIMLDTRLYDRDQQNLTATNDTTRHMMGPVERAWFFQQLDDTSTRWKIIGNQVMFAPLQILGVPVNADQWDGYNYERGLIENHILNNVNDVVILTGDIHSTWCNDVPGPNYNSNTGAGSVCVEFVGTSVTSPALSISVGANLIKVMNPHEKYVDLTNHGFYTLTVSKTKTQADYTYVSTITQLGSTDVAGPKYYVSDGQRNLTAASAPMPSQTITAPNPPLNPNQAIPFFKITDQYVTVQEGHTVTANVIPSLQVCPAVTVQHTTPNHGYVITLNGMDYSYSPAANYNGYDTVAFYICTTDTVPVCDTVYMYITVNSVQTIDTFLVDIGRDTIYHGCLTFDDLTGPATFVHSTNAQGGIVVINDTCFTYLPDSSFQGRDTIVFTACDAGNNCDTIVYIFKVNYPTYHKVIDLYLQKNTQLTYCLNFDDVLLRPSHIVLSRQPSNATYSFISDSCFKYIPYYNYIGNDTVQFVNCDTIGFNHCDTITIIYHVTDVSGVKSNNLVVFGMYPNPVDDELVIQYYLFNNEDIAFAVYDAAGRIIRTQKVAHADYGLQYLVLNTSQFPSGNYIVELKGNTGSYRKQVIKK